ncbi:WXG100 family type VII secretion target [Butyrivibrio sp. YAB3001]|uniref:WXG100 family type VII secretion target n=1 Tax=Butyrivibrio sp. YAB3001 TaxID=1520812 RepID=UPI0008F68457|nr:WXG100 family type VII secretion target [Butyrivibrio sp. YAB3001]SFB82396.1 WXG100 family type VII secretion target [Butyrivibrio sp. YAB3001]
MAEIYVKSSNDIQEVINNLRRLNTEFRNKANDINTEQTNLTTKWRGDASTSFQENFRKEYPNFESFATTIDEYVEGLTQILDEYNRTEDMNKQIASN